MAAIKFFDTKEKGLGRLTGKGPLGGLAPYIARKHGITIKKLGEWGHHDLAEAERFIRLISNVRFTPQKGLVLEKEKNVSLLQAAAAVRYASKLKSDSSAYFPLTVKIRSNTTFDVFFTNKHEVILGGKFLEGLLLPPENKKFSDFVCAEKLKNNRELLKKDGLSPDDITDKRAFAELMVNHLKKVTFANLSNQFVFPVLGEMAKWILYLPRLRDLAMQKTETFETRFLRHTANVLADYNQIPRIVFEEGLASDENPKGLLRLFRPVEPKEKIPDQVRFDRMLFMQRVKSNLNFVRELSLRVPGRLMYATIFMHDIGKLMEEIFHHEEGYKLIEKYGLMDYWGLTETEKLIAKMVIRYHVIPGGIFIGEYSPSIFCEMFSDPQMRQIMDDGKFELFADAFTLLTICDIAALDKYLPLNRRVENFQHLNKFLKDFVGNNFTAIVADDYFENCVRIPAELRGISEYIAEEKVGLLLAGDDKFIDVNTQENDYSFYINKIRDAVRRNGINRRRWREAVSAFSHISSFNYGSKFLSTTFWEKDGGNLRVTQRSKVSSNGLFFLLALAEKVKDVDKGRGLPVVALLKNGSTGETLSYEDYDPFTKNFKDKLEKGYMPAMEAREDDGSIILDIILPKPE